jgi:two-component system NarL family sensor kinase
VALSRDVTRRKAEEASLRRLPQFIREAQESERRRVARELHDGVIQILSSVKFRFQSIEERLEKRNSDLSLDAVKASALLDRAIVEVRQIARNLRPGELDDLGLAPAMRSLAEEVKDRTGLRLEVHVAHLPCPLPPDWELHVYRIVQEALANVARHAKAKWARVALTVAPPGRAFELEVVDDGRGFDFAADERSPHGAPGGRLGLVDIRERARLMGAEAHWKPREGGGTQFTLRGPLPCPAPAPKTRQSPRTSHASARSSCCWSTITPSCGTA